MPYPPPVPPATRTNATVMATNHPADHNLMSAALTEILNHLAQVEASLYPIGTITMTGADIAPGNHLLCRGQSVSRTEYPEVFALYGTKFGTADVNSFNLPSFQGRSPMGLYPGGAWASAFMPLIGNQNSVLPSHQHTTPDHLHYGVDHYHYAQSAGSPGLSIPPHNHGPLAQAFVTWSPGSGQGLGAAQPWAIEFGTPPATDELSAAGQRVGGLTGAADRDLKTGLSDRVLNTTFAGIDGNLGNIHPSTVINFMIRMH